MPTVEEIEMMTSQQPRTINEEIGPESAQLVMQADPDIQFILLSRLESLSREELQALDRAINSESAKVLLKLLPELEELIGISVSRKSAGGANMGALAGM